MTTPRIPVSLSTASAYPQGCAAAFEHAAEAGYDGMEVMVWSEPVTRNAERLTRLAKEYDQPVRAIHAPTLLLTQMVWGIDPWVKVERSAQLAVDTGAQTVVVHPPFRWQPKYAERFQTGVAELAEKYDVHIAVENMYPWRFKEQQGKVYLPGWDPRDWDYQDVTLDLSHTATSKSDALAMAEDLGSKLRHVHLADGLGSPKDEHLLPGKGNQKCAEVMEFVGQADWPVQVVVEVNTRGLGSTTERRAALTQCADFARRHLEAAPSDD